MTSTELFDPEVRILLEEAVADPQSYLFRIPTERISVWMGGREEGVSSQSSGLTKRERHLVEVWREEAAELLLEACRRRLAAVPIEESYGYNLQTTSFFGFEERCKRLALNSFGESPPPALEGFASEAIPGSQLAAASLRVAPRDEARIYMAVLLRLEGALGTAKRTIHRTLDLTLTNAIRSYALTQLGQYLLESMESSKALECYELSAELDPDRVVPAINSFVTAIEVGIPEKIRDHAKRFSDHDVQQNEMDQLRRILSSAATNGIIRHDPTVRDTWMKIRDRLPRAASEVYDALS